MRQRTLERDRPYSAEEIHLLAAAAAESKRGERDALLVEVIFAGLKPKRARSLRLSNIARLPSGKATFDIEGKGGKSESLSCPTKLADRLEAYAKKHGLLPGGRFFGISRMQIWHIIRTAGKRADLGNATPSLVYQSGQSSRHRESQSGEDIKGALCETCKFRLFWRKYRHKGDML